MLKSEIQALLLRNKGTLRILSSSNRIFSACEEGKQLQNGPVCTNGSYLAYPSKGVT